MFMAYLLFGVGSVVAIAEPTELLNSAEEMRCDLRRDVPLAVFSAF